MAALQPAPSAPVANRAPSIENEGDVNSVVVQDDAKGQYERGVRILQAQVNLIISSLLVIVLGGSGYIIAELVINNTETLNP